MNAFPRKYLILFALLVVVLMTSLLAALLGYGKLKIATHERQKKVEKHKVAVLVAVDPIAYLVERVGGERTTVATLTPQGKDPESFAPTPKQLADVAASRVFFRVGLPIEERFAQNVSSIAPDVETVDLRVGLATLPNPHLHADEEENLHDEHYEHMEDSLDPHVWTSPANVRVMIVKIAETLVAIDPKGAESYRSNALEFDKELAALQEEVSRRLAPYKGRAFVVFHPAYGYFAREFGLTQLAVESEGKAPRPRQLEELVERIREDSVQKLIVQPEFNRSSALVVADAVGATLVEHSPLIKDYFEEIRSLTDDVVGAFASQE